MPDQERAYFCVVEYLYRDAANWKTHGEALVSGHLSGEKIQRIDALLDGDRVFVPGEVGLPPLHVMHELTYGTDPDLDHDLHEFVCLRPAKELDLIASSAICTVEEFITALLVAGWSGRSK